MKSFAAPGTLYSYGPRYTTGSVRKLPCPGGDGADIRINNIVAQAAVPTRTVDYTLPFGAFGGLGAQGFILTSANFGYDESVEGQLAAAGHASFSPVLTTNVPFETLFCGPTVPVTCGTTNAGGRTIAYAMKVAALDTGADDYIAKRFSTPELLARLRAAQRKTRPA